MLAKTIGIALLVSTFTVYVFAGGAPTGDVAMGEKILANAKAKLDLDEDCAGVIDNHLEIVEQTEEYFAKVFAKSEYQIAPFEIMLTQKVLKARFDHLMKTMAKFKSASDCNNQMLGEVVAVYDLNTLASSIMENPHARQVVHSFTKASDYGMSYFKDQYNFYTRIRNVEAVRNSLTSSDLGLLEMFGLKINQTKSGVKSSTTGDKLKRIWGWTIGKGVIRTWGKMSDTLKLRSGHLRYSKTSSEMIRKSLKPLDLIFEQRRFVLSSITIPGNWGHVGVWLGTKPELQAMGLWDREDFKVFRKQIEQGNNIVNMRKEGVVFNTLQEFMNLDEVAVMRVEKVQIDPSSVYPLMAEQLNKSYDFSFDAKTLGKITCTEFVSFSFGNIAWPSRLQMGRMVITPDDMAKLSLDSTQAQLISYIGSDDGEPQVKTVKDWFDAINPEN